MLTAHNGGVLALLLLLGILLRLTGSATASRPQQAVLPVGVHAFFYLWYGTPEVDGSWRHWDHEVLPHWREDVNKQYPANVHFLPPEELHAPYYPARGPYSSSNATLLREHMASMMQQGGISTAVISWWGRPDMPGTHDTQGVGTDHVVREVLSAAAFTGLKVAFHMEPYAGRSADSFADDVRYIQQHYGDSPALLRAQDGRIVYYLYDSYHVKPEEWASILDPDGIKSIRGTPADGVFLGLWLHQHHGRELYEGGFDGSYSYFASTSFSWGSTLRNWAHMSSWSATRGMTFVPSVGPGYDDRRIRPWNKHNYKSREQGAYYRRMWEQALAVRPRVVSITSFNEWGEGTQIEAAVPASVPDGLGLAPEVRAKLGLKVKYEDYAPHGPDYYMDETAKWSLQLRQLWEPSHDEEL